MVSVPFVPPSTVPIYSLPSVVPSVLSAPLPSAPPLPTSSSFPLGPPPGFASVSSLPSSLPPPSASAFFPGALSASSSLSSSWPSVSSSSSSWSSRPASSVLPPVSSTSAPSLDFAAYQAQVLGLSDEYQALGMWYVASGG